VPSAPDNKMRRLPINCDESQDELLLIATGASGYRRDFPADLPAEGNRHAPAAEMAGVFRIGQRFRVHCWSDRRLCCAAEQDDGRLRQTERYPEKSTPVCEKDQQ